MERYTWSFDGVEFGKSTPVRFRHGERLRVILHNDTMMTHPMHLHGLWSELEAPDGPSRRGGTPSRFSPRSASASSSPPTRSAAGPGIAT